MGFNKGEWSELYTFLALLAQPDLQIVDENLQTINQRTFEIQEIYIANKSSYRIKGDRNIIKISPKGVEKTYLKDEISKQSKLLLDKIQTHKKARGAFEIDEIQPLVDDLLDGDKLKGSSRVKGDLEALVLDKKVAKTIKLKYNIKSNLGAKATLLNASNHTNFIYEVTNINDDIMNKNNAIKTRKKLIERCNFLKSNGAKFHFVQTQSSVFANNLKLIDSDLGTILSKMLILSYEQNEKNIQKLLSLIISDKASEVYYKKKMGDFANAVTFGMRASQEWDGTNEVNGGIIIVTKRGEIYLLDLIYFKEVVNKYLRDNIKLESPSFNRYKMFEVYKEEGRYYFKLNLQIRFK